MFKVYNRNTRTSCEICSKLTIDIRTMPLVSLLLTLTYFTPCSSVCIVNFEQVKAGWLESTELYLFFECRVTTQ